MGFAMSEHVHMDLPEYLLGILPNEERTAVSEHVRGCSECTDELRSVSDALTLLALSLEPIAPAPSLRARLLDVAQSDTYRLAPFARRLAALLDIGRLRAAELLEGVFDPGRWLDAPWPSVMHLPLAGGPATRGADVLLMRCAPGTGTPTHVHRGAEHVLVLQGSLKGADGRVLSRGDFVEWPSGQPHSLVALGNEDLITAVVVHGQAFPGGEG